MKNKFKKYLEKLELTINSFVCCCFHSIEIMENCSFIDKITRKAVGKFKCKKCNKKYLSNSKRSYFRCYI